MSRRLDPIRAAGQNTQPHPPDATYVKRCFATIVSPNYLAYACVLRDSVLRHAPEADFQVLMVNRPDAAVGAAVAEAGLKVTHATELDLPGFEQIAYKYDLVELNTALKPSFMKALFARGFDEVVYLDPDTCLYDAPLPVTQALEDAQIVLIPHALAPAMDGLRPSDIDFLRTGTFNLGFVALRRGEQALALLDWWERRCLSHGFNDPGFGTFVDQKWMDLAPCYFDSVRLLKHPGCNVAYWNLHERQVETDGANYRVNGQQLVFFHYSGVQALAPQVLSRHQTRHQLVAGQPVTRLVADYCDRLLEAGHQRWSGLPYSFGRLDDGTLITSAMRRAAGLASMDAGRPFDPASPLQRALRNAGLAGGNAQGLDKATTLNFDPSDRRVVWVNRVVRLLGRIIGVERLSALLRYAGFLTWQSNLASVLLDRPLEIDHRDRR